MSSSSASSSSVSSSASSSIPRSRSLEELAVGNFSPVEMGELRGRSFTPVSQESELLDSASSASSVAADIISVVDLGNRVPAVQNAVQNPLGNGQIPPNLIMLYIGQAVAAYHS